MVSCIIYYIKYLFIYYYKYLLDINHNFSFNILHKLLLIKNINLTYHKINYNNYCFKNYLIIY